MTKKFGLIAAAGKARRINGIPKFLLPIKKHNNLLSNTTNWLENSGVDNIYLGTNKTFENLIKNLDLFSKKIKSKNLEVVTTNTMNETINKLIPKTAKPDDIFITMMPDTYFDDHGLGRKIIKKLEKEENLEAVVGLFQMREDQRGKLGQCQVNDNFITEVIDKSESCNFKYIWGVIAWRNSYGKYIVNSDLSIGLSINRAIKDKKQVGFVVSSSTYFDCGSIDEYWKLIKFLT